jgi:hypothetical protein
MEQQVFDFLPRRKRKQHSRTVVALFSIDKACVSVEQAITTRLYIFNPETAVCVSNGFIPKLIGSVITGGRQSDLRLPDRHCAWLLNDLTLYRAIL